METVCRSLMESRSALNGPLVLDGIKRFFVTGRYSI